MVGNSKRKPSKNNQERERERDRGEERILAFGPQLRGEKSDLKASLLFKNLPIHSLLDAHSDSVRSTEERFYHLARQQNVTLDDTVNTARCRELYIFPANDVFRIHSITLVHSITLSHGIVRALGRAIPVLCANIHCRTVLRCFTGQQMCSRRLVSYLCQFID